MSKVYIHENTHGHVLTDKMLYDYKLLFVTDDAVKLHDFIEPMYKEFGCRYCDELMNKAKRFIMNTRHNEVEFCSLHSDDEFEDDEDYEDEADETEAHDDENRWFSGYDDLEDANVKLTCSECRCIAEALDYFMSYHDVSDSEKEMIENLLYDVL